jgi:secreted Zn-dependent insulinase-like peptidase
MSKAFYNTNATPMADQIALSKSLGLSKCKNDEDIENILTKDYLYRDIDKAIIKETLDVMSNPDNAYFVFISNLNSTLDMLIIEPIYKTKFRVDPLHYGSIKTAFDL